MNLLRLQPVFKNYLWGGEKLKRDFGKRAEGIVAESWELSCHPEGLSRIAGGPFDGRTFHDYLEECGKDVLGSACAAFDRFPQLIKWIDAREDLSIQVHPGDEYAQRVEGDWGKTEVWYVADCDPDAVLYYGFRRAVSRERLASHISEGRIVELLNRVEVKKGDVFFVEAGTVHAIGKGILVAEIQENSNATYRVDDFGRTDAMGRPRPLHIDKALDVIRLKQTDLPKDTRGDGGHLAQCKYFTIDKLDVPKQETFSVGSGSFKAFLCVDGAGTLKAGPDSYPFSRGDTLFLPAGIGAVAATGPFEALLSYVEPEIPGKNAEPALTSSSSS